MLRATETGTTGRPSSSTLLPPSGGQASSPSARRCSTLRDGGRQWSPRRPVQSWRRWLVVTPSVRSEHRPSHYADAGMTLLRSSPSDGKEIWCRCDAGRHGFLSIAAHAHADALSVEVRHDGVDVLADPGTYCYHGEPSWRRYFRSTLAHNTIEVGGQDQSSSGGPFLWTRHTQSTLVGLERDERGDVTAWSAEHDGYGALNPPVLHRRSVRLDSRLRRLEIVDCLETTGSHAIRLAFHLGPDIDARMVGADCGPLLGPRNHSRELPNFAYPTDSRGRSREVRPTRSSVGTPHVLGRSSRPGVLSEKDLAVGSVRTPSRRCSSSLAELGPRPPGAVNRRCSFENSGIWPTLVCSNRP